MENKRIINKYIKSISSYDLESKTVEELCDFLRENLSGTQFLSFDYDTSEVEIRDEMVETYQEFEKRISAEKIRKETVEAQERLQYLKLKEKYDGKFE